MQERVSVGPGRGCCIRLRFFYLQEIYRRSFPNSLPYRLRNGSIISQPQRIGSFPLPGMRIRRGTRVFSAPTVSEQVGVTDCRSEGEYRWVAGLSVARSQISHFLQFRLLCCPDFLLNNSFINYAAATSWKPRASACLSSCACWRSRDRGVILKASDSS